MLCHPRAGLHVARLFRLKCSKACRGHCPRVTDLAWGMRLSAWTQLIKEVACWRQAASACSMWQLSCSGSRLAASSALLPMELGVCAGVAARSATSGRLLRRRERMLCHPLAGLHVARLFKLNYS